MDVVRGLASPGVAGTPRDLDAAPHYTHWHGLYEVAKVFYTEFIPEAQEAVARGVAAGGTRTEAAKQVARLIDATLASDDHRWFLGQMTQEERAQRAKQREEFTKRYLTQQEKKP